MLYRVQRPPCPENYPPVYYYDPYFYSMLSINKEYFLSPPEERDVPFYLEFLNDKEISERTLTIPFPYTERDARLYLEFCVNKKKEFGREMSWIIRNGKGELCGGISWHGKYPNQPHREEVGYWLARPYWNRGVMSNALERFCEYGFSECGYHRIEAPIFDFNHASQRVAEKCGFTKEGVMHKAYFKEGKFIDGVMYVLTR